MFDDLTEDILKGMIRQVTLGLEHIHSKNIVHLDLKPENLIANRNPNGDFNCKIVDFGIAEHVTDEFGFIRAAEFCPNHSLCSIAYALSIKRYKTLNQASFIEWYRWLQCTRTDSV